MSSRALIFVTMLAIVLSGAVYAADIALELAMPGAMFWPGAACGLGLNVNNAGASLTGAQLYVALTLGTDEFWFYPSWAHYPPAVDSQTVDVAQTQETLPILQEFPWPEGGGEFTGAMFYAAITAGGNLVSNLADVTFGWTETAPPTPTPPPSTPTPTDTPTPTVTPFAAPGDLYATDAIVGNMRAVPKGNFAQGSPDDELCRSDDETSFRNYLTRDIVVMETEISVQMWLDLKAVQDTLVDDPSQTWASPMPNNPVQNITWHESILFANLLSLQNGFSRCYFRDAAFTIPVDASNYSTGHFFCNFDSDGYRLPFAGESEYFCRAGTTTPFSCDEQNYTADNCDSCDHHIHPTLEQYCVYCALGPNSTGWVGSMLPNPWNLKDVHGNVWEWCWDWYGPYPTGRQLDYMGAGNGSNRVYRGGGWDLGALENRSARRGAGAPDYRNYDLGFRLVRTVL